MAQSPTASKTKRRITNRSVDDNEQSKKFIQAARELGMSEQEEKFDESLLKILGVRPS